MSQRFSPFKLSQPGSPAVAQSPAAHGVFDSEALSLMQAALERAWAALLPDQQTAETRERIARAVVNLAMQWERDPADLGLAERPQISISVD
jgi:hypothetical protein